MYIHFSAHVYELFKSLFGCFVFSAFRIRFSSCKYAKICCSLNWDYIKCLCHLRDNFGKIESSNQGVQCNSPLFRSSLIYLNKTYDFSLVFCTYFDRFTPTHFMFLMLFKNYLLQIVFLTVFGWYAKINWFSKLTYLLNLMCTFKIY